MTSQFPAWQDISSAPKHRNDVLVINAAGRVGIGWFSQMAAGPLLNLEHIAEGSLQPTLDKELAARQITHWMPLPEAPE